MAARAANTIPARGISTAFSSRFSNLAAARFGQFRN
nr:MAG TPA: hypothetical protein [Caudoviricetes sp.]